MDINLDIFKKIADSDIHAYEAVFKEYYKFLCSYAYGITKERHIAEEIVEDFFVYLWNNRKNMSINSSVRSYFIGSIHNRCLNYLQREKPKFVSSQDISQLIDREGSAGDKLISIEVPSILSNELESVLARAIDNLPVSCKEIFLLSRKNELSYEEIAQKLGLSLNTVKTQIKIALRKLRENLKDYLVVLLFFII